MYVEKQLITLFAFKIDTIENGNFPSRRHCIEMVFNMSM